MPKKHINHREQDIKHIPSPFPFSYLSKQEQLIRLNENELEKLVGDVVSREIASAGEMGKIFDLLVDYFYSVIASTDILDSTEMARFKSVVGELIKQINDSAYSESEKKPLLTKLETINKFWR